MALSGSISTTIRGREYRIEWSATQSIADNTSTITCVHKLINDSTFSLYIDSRSNSCTVGDSSKTFTSSAISTSGGSTIKLGTTTHTIKHNSDGTKKVTITGIFNIKATLSGTYTASLKASDTVTLNTIPRASSLSLSATSVNVGSPITATITRASSNFTHTVEFYINSTYYKKYTGVGTSQAYTIPTDWYKAMPSSTSCTAYCRITTYNGSTQIGSQVKKSFTVKVPSSIKPELGDVTLNPVNITTEDGTSRNILVKGKNKIKVSVSDCKAGSGSSIKSYTFAVLYGSTTINTITTTSTSATFGPFSQSGTLKFRVTVTDKRSRSTSNKDSEETWTCINYASPSFSAFKAYRANSSGSANANGTYLKCTFTSSYSPVNSTNSATVTAYYNDGSTTKSKDASDGQVLINLGESDKTYKVYLKISDNYGGTATSSTRTVFGQTRVLNVTKDGTGVAIGKMAENKNTFECRWPSKFNDNVDSSGNIRINSGDSKVFEVTRTRDTSDIQMQLYIHDNGYATCRRRDKESGESDYTTKSYWQLRDSYMYVGHPMTVNGTMTADRGRFTATTDADPAKQNDVPLRIGDDSGNHIDIDGNEIIAKSSATSLNDINIVGNQVILYGGTTDVLHVGLNSGNEPVVYSPTTYARTYDSSPNMYITSNGVFGRSTSSSMRYKNEIENVTNDDLNPYRILDIPVRQYKYNADHVPIGKCADDLYLGLVAEEVEAALPSAAEYNEEGQVEMWNIKVLFPALLKIVQDQQKEIQSLKDTINNIVGTSSNNVE